MAKRVSPEEKPYRPVDEALVRSVLAPPVAPNANLVPAPSNGSELSLNGNSLSSPLNGSSTTPPEPPPGPTTLDSCLALAPPEEERGPVPGLLSEPTPALEKLTREKRLLLTPSEELDLERLVVDLTERLGTPVKLSHVLRATVTLLRRAREELLQESRRVGALKRPYNGDGVALVAFEQSLAQIIDTSLRNAGPLT